MGKIKNKSAAKKITLDNGDNSDLSETIGDYSTQAVASTAKYKTLESNKLFDFQKPPYYDKLEKKPDLFLKSAYKDEEDSLYYSEEDLLGEDSLDNYSYKYHKMYRLEEKKKNLLDKKTSPILDYLLEVDKDKKIPKSLGLVNRKSKNNEIVANNFLFGDRYAEPFSKGINQRRKLEALNLNENRLSDSGFSKILTMAPKTLLILDISYNPTLTLETYTKIAEYLEDESTILQQFMIEGNQTGDKAIILLSDVIRTNRYLKYWNISKNNITDIGAIEVAKVIKENKILNVLFMHWNKIRETGGK